MEYFKQILLSLKENHATSYMRLYSELGGYKNTFYFLNHTSFKLDLPNKFNLDKPIIKLGVENKSILLENTEFYSLEEKLAISDFILRQFNDILANKNKDYYNRNKPSKVTGMFYGYPISQRINSNNAAYFTNNNCINILCQVQLPVTMDKGLPNIKKAMDILVKDVPFMIRELTNNLNYDKLQHWIEVTKIQYEIRKYLKNSPYCTFIANGSILPRKSGTDKPNLDAIPFQSPVENQVEIFLENGNSIKGMGIKKGITAITGGGYSGKSTILDAISSGIYNHIPGDGREFVITDDSAIKIVAEDGRPVNSIDVSKFITWIPGCDSTKFSTSHASGSTSQSANIIEGISYGSKVFLIDEDRSATNFMIKDKNMKRLIKKEPIIPFIERVQELYNSLGISTIIVIGANSEYIEIADNVILMEDFMAYNYTKESKRICGYREIRELNIEKSSNNWCTKRKVLAEGFVRSMKDIFYEKIEVVECETLIINNERIDVRSIEGIVSQEQLNSIAYILRSIKNSSESDIIDIEKVLDNAYKNIEQHGLDYFHTNRFNINRWMELPRKCEVMSVINRMRNIKIV